jgi:xanthine dehydrogenase accessory factor
MEATPFPDWPTFGLADDVIPALGQAVARGQPAALVTLHRAVGPSPRPEGAQMLVGREELSGFLSGGCVEGDIVGHARRCLDDGAPRRLVYGQGSPYPDIRLLCGSRIELLVEAVAPDDAAARRLLELRAQRRPAFWATNGRNRACASTPPRRDGMDFVRRFDPTPRLVVVGGDPTALALASLGVSMGFDTHLVRPRGPESPPPIPGLAYHRAASDQRLESVSLDPWTYVAVATHDLETDEAALCAALASHAAYVGVLGARRRLPERMARLARQGVSDAALTRLHAPIGLDLGGKAPFEIAVAIMGEIIRARQGATPPLLLRDA